MGRKPLVQVRREEFLESDRIILPSLIEHSHAGKMSWISKTRNGERRVHQLNVVPFQQAEVGQIILTFNLSLRIYWKYC